MKFMKIMMHQRIKSRTLQGPDLFFYHIVKELW